MLNLISNDIKTILANKKMNNDHKTVDNLTAVHDEIAVLKTIISTHVNYEEMNLVMTDIKESLELYINETPRDNNRSELDDLYQKMESMKSQMNVLQDIINSLHKMEILDAPMTRHIDVVLPQTTKIPKLVIKRSLKI